jgi:hypothetical protein
MSFFWCLWLSKGPPKKIGASAMEGIREDQREGGKDQGERRKEQDSIRTGSFRRLELFQVPRSSVSALPLPPHKLLYRLFSLSNCTHPGPEDSQKPLRAQSTSLLIIFIFCHINVYPNIP